MKLVKYSAVWCGPCKTYNPVIEKVATELSIPLEHVDVDKTPTEGIMSVPTTHLVSDSGVVVAEVVGALPERKLKAWIAENTPRF